MAVRQQRNVAYGQNQPLINVFPFPIVAQRDPTVNDRAEIGTIWINLSSNDAFVLTSIVANVSTWISIAGGAAVFSSITVNPGPFTFTGTGDFTLNTTGALLMDADGTSHITIDDDFTISTTSNGSDLSLSASGVGSNVLIDSAASDVSITAANDITVSSDEILTLESDHAAGNAIIINATDATGEILIQTAGESITLSTTGEGRIFLRSFPVTTAGNNADASDAYMGTCTQTGLTTAAGAFETITITTTVCTVDSGILVSAANFGANDAKMTVARVIPGAGLFDVILLNNGAAALNGDLVISFMIINI